MFGFIITRFGLSHNWRWGIFIRNPFYVLNLPVNRNSLTKNYTGKWKFKWGQASKISADIYDKTQTSH